MTETYSYVDIAERAADLLTALTDEGSTDEDIFDAMDALRVPLELLGYYNQDLGDDGAPTVKVIDEMAPLEP